MTRQDEFVIIKKVTGGDIASFSILVDCYKNRAIALALTIVLNRQDAEDLVQEAFIKAYSSLKSFKGNSLFSTWFYRIVLNTSLNNRRLKRPDTVAIEDYDNGDIEADTFNALSRFNNNEQKKFIQSALMVLNESERIFITMFYLNELSIEEIVELTGFTSSNIKVLLHRARKTLYREFYRLLKNEMKDLI